MRQQPKNIFLLTGAALGAIVMMIPIQHYISLGRYQHYGIAIFMFGLGYALHCIWTWRDQTFWPRLCYAFTGAFFSSVGLLFYANPWMDWKTNVQTEEKQLLRLGLSGVYLLFGFALLVVWLIAYYKKTKSEKNQLQ